MAYYNTTNETGGKLKIYEDKALKLEDRIIELFKANPRAIASPSQVCLKLGTDIPLTSYRRAMTDLTSKGLLEKTEKKRTGPYGRPEGMWKLKI